MPTKSIVPGLTISGEGDPIMDPFRAHIMRNVLRHQVGQAIFCPGRHCDGAVMDARRAVGLGTTTVCIVCWGSLTDEQRQQVADTAAEKDIELLDGPALHGRKAVIPAPTTTEV